MEATAQVLDSANEAGFTTNHIAARAGVSIGTLYRYFPNKRKILEHMVARETRRKERSVLTFLDRAGETAGTNLIRFVVRTSLGAFGGRMTVRRRLLTALLADRALVAAVHETRLRILRALEDKLVENEPGSYRRLTEAERLCLLGAYIGAINATLLHTSQPRGTDELERQLCALMAQFLSKGGRFDGLSASARSPQ